MSPHAPRRWILPLALAAMLTGPLLAQEASPESPEVNGAAVGDAEREVPEQTPTALEPIPATPPGTAPPPGETSGENAASAEDEPTTTFAVRDRTITGSLSVIQRDLGANLIPRGAAAEQTIAEFAVRGLTLDELLQKFNTELGWQWYQDDTMPSNTYELYTDEDFRAMVLPRLVIEKSFYLENIPAETAQGFVQEMLSEVGTVSAISRTNEIIVTDLPQYVEAVERLIEQIDVRLYIRVFRIRHANVEDIAAALERLQSPDGTMEVDSRNHTIIVEDLFQNIRRMDLMVELLDVGTELRTYSLNYMSEDDMADLESALLDIVTPDAFLRVEYRTGQIILQDIPEIHERAAEIIAAYDQPTRQIMLQADVVQVRTTNNIDFSTDFALSGDLFSARQDGIGGVTDVPISGRTGADLTDNLGFLNLRDEFPVFAIDGSGLRFEYLSSHFRALLTASLESGNARLLLSPRIQVKDKEPATIDVGGEVPFVTTTINDNTSTSTRTFTQQAVREGLLLEVTPFITNTGYVELQVRIENNDAEVQQRTVIDGTIDVVERRTQQVETVLIVPDGATRVIAGLLSSTSSTSHNGVPFLSNMPYVGWLFGSHSDDQFRDNLMIFLTPNIIVESAADYEWRPTYDERPISARFATTQREEPAPTRPPDVDLLMPLLEPRTSFEPNAGTDSLPTLDEAPILALPRDAALPGEMTPDEPIPVPPLGPGEPPDASEAPLMSLPEEFVSSPEHSLPLVDFDLSPLEPGTAPDEVDGPRTSFSGMTPRVQGSLLSSGQESGRTTVLGGGGSSTGGASRGPRTGRTEGQPPGSETEVRGSRPRAPRSRRTDDTSSDSSGIVDYQQQQSERER